jgi:Histidine kinase-like ATPase domain
MTGPKPDDRHRRLELEGAATSVAIGRDFIRQALADWHWIPQNPGPSRQTVVADILLVVSELLANSVMHASGTVRLAVGVDADAKALRIEVTDADSAMPAPLSPHQPGLPGGHGLFIVEQLSDRWGVAAGADGGESGKTVWAEVDTVRLDADLPLLVTDTPEFEGSESGDESVNSMPGNLESVNSESVNLESVNLESVNSESEVREAR